MQHVPSSSVVFHGSSAQARYFSPLKSGYHQRILLTSPVKNSSENLDVEDRISKVEKLCERIYVRLEEINKKTDTIILNQRRLNRSLPPNEKRLQKPENLPALPVKTEDELNLLETFLENDNLAAVHFNLKQRSREIKEFMCDYFSCFVTSKDVTKSTVKIAVKVLSNSIASTMSFKAQNKKNPFIN